MTINSHSRYCQRVGFFLALWSGVPGILAAQPNAESSGAAHRTVRESGALAPGLVSADLGLRIIGAALESRRPTDSNADCSNLVHAIYERAGFTYSYANSFELYRGIKEFRRVLHPQPGDLVVWRGHVGIVISPVQRSFFSAMRSGRGVEFYDSPYWQSRGRPRFFRYLKAASRTQFSASRKPDLKPRSSSNAQSHDPVPADELAHADPPAALPQIEGPQAASLPKSESRTTASDAQSATDRNKRTPASHKIQGPGDGVWVTTATKPSPEIPFDSAATPAPRPSQGFRTSNITAKAGPAGATPPSAGGPLVNESRAEPVQWAMSRYVPRPPWSSSSGRTSEPSIPRPPARRVPRASQGSY
jgi:hypothetical protein